MVVNSQWVGSERGRCCGQVGGRHMVWSVRVGGDPAWPGEEDKSLGRVAGRILRLR